jgi:hypothetical protein
MTPFDDLDIFAPLDDDVDDDLWTPRHAKHEQRKPMKTMLRFTTQLLVLVAIGYATMWMMWQFALLLNTVTTQVWQ